jgi:hypothetical protein
MRRKLFAMLFSVVMLGLIGVPNAKADSGNEAINFTVKKGVVELPGRVLTPGTYDMRFLDMEHTVVLVTTANGTEPIGFFDVIPISRDRRRDHVKLEFSEPTKTAPERLMGFFYPDTKTGYEFQYPQPAATLQASKPQVGAHS